MAGGGEPSGEDATATYMECCFELGCQPVQAFAECLRTGSRICKVTSVSGEADQLFATASLLPYANLLELDCSGLELSLEGWCTLLQACSRCPGLQVLSIKGCKLGELSNDAQGMVGGLLGSCQVAVLDASQNALGDAFAASLGRSSLVCHSDSQLTVLDLSDNQIGDEGAAALAGALQVNGLSVSLKQLDLSFNELRDRGARALASMLAAVPLMALELEGNQITDIGGVALAAALKKTLCLQRLNLNHNRFALGTVAALADAVRMPAGTLQELAVAGANGTERGVATLLRAACGSKQLQLLDVRGLALDCEAVDALCQLLASPCPLVTLRLDVATKDAAEAVAQALPSNASLLHLMMGGPVPEHVLSFVAATLSSNTMSKLQQHSRMASPRGDAPAAQCEPAQLRRRPPPTAQQQQQQQQPHLWSPSASLPDRAHGSPPQLPRSAGSKPHTPPQRPGSAGSLSSLGTGSTSSAKRSLVRTLTQQARRASGLDPAGLAGLAGGGAAHKAAEVFRRHDGDGSGTLDAEEMMAALQDLGMLDGMRARQLGKFLSTALREADGDCDGRIGLHDFVRYYERLARHYAEASRAGRIVARCKAPPVVPVNAVADDALKRLFKAACRLRLGQGRQPGSSAQSLNLAQFQQLCRDAGLVEPQGVLSQCAVDIVFVRAQPAGSRRLSFREFLEALAALAQEVGCDFAAVAGAMVAQAGAAAASPREDEAGGSDGNGSRHTAFSSLAISDLVDKRVGPVLPARAGLRSAAALGASIDSSLRAAAAAGARGGGAGAADQPGAAAAGAPRDPNPLRASAGAALCSMRPLPGYQQQQQQQPSQPQQRRSPLQEAELSGEAVHNPLFERESDGAGDAKATALELRLTALEAKLKSQASAAADLLSSQPAPADAIPAGNLPSGDLDARLLQLEADAEGQQQLLAALQGQQQQLKELCDTLTAALETSGLLGGISQATTGQLVESLGKEVEGLTAEVGSLKGLRARVESEHGALRELARKTEELARKTEDRQARAETAIFQVARQVDVLDARLQEEQESSLRALEALVASQPK